MDFGTGALGVTPAHSIIDSQIAQKNNLPSIKVIDEDGNIYNTFGKFSKKSVLEARKMIIEELQEKELIIKAQAGDLQAFSELIKIHEQRLLKVASIIIPGEQEDVLQETFISAFRGIKNFRGNSGFYTWLYRILLNNIYRRFNQHKKKSCIPKMHNLIS